MGETELSDSNENQQLDERESTDKVINQTETDTNRPYVGFVPETAPMQQAGLTVTEDNSYSPQTYNPQTTTATATTPDLKVTQVAGATDQQTLSYTQTELASEFEAKPPESSPMDSILPILLVVFIIAGVLCAVVFMKKIKNSTSS